MKRILLKISKKTLFLVLVLLVLLVWLAACAPAELTPTSPLPAAIPTTSALGPGEIVVAAASDLNFAFTEIAQRFEEETEHRVTLVFGSSGNLTQQIENGAPFDLFASANTAYLDRLAGQGLLLDETIEVYARGSLVLAVNRQAGVQASTLKDLLSPTIHSIAIANPAHAPYGQAARQALESAGLWDQLQEKLVFGENIRQALQYVQSGDAQAGLLALSVASVPEISWMMVDGELHDPIDQALAVTTYSRRPDIGRQFAAFVGSEPGRQILYSYGFQFPDAVEPPSTPLP